MGMANCTILPRVFRKGNACGHFRGSSKMNIVPHTVLIPVMLVLLQWLIHKWTRCLKVGEISGWVEVMAEKLGQTRD